jgi:hypothetical protein
MIDRNITCSWAGLTVALALCATPTARSLAHEGEMETTTRPVPAEALLQIEATRHATARFRDVAEAEKAGYVDIGLFVPHMGHHYLNADLLDETFDADRPELLVYADDPCGGQRRLVAVEYAVPLALAKVAPAGFAGPADAWAVNNQFQLWTLHAWIWQYNANGLFAGFNPAVP